MGIGGGEKGDRPLGTGEVKERGEGGWREKERQRDRQKSREREKNGRWAGPF